MGNRPEEDLARVTEQLRTAGGEDLVRVHRKLLELVDRGLIEVDALFKLLEEGASKLATPREQADRHFGALAVESGLLTPAQLDAALAEQRVLASRGLKLFLGQILQRMNRLTVNQVLEILRRQNKHVVACPCGQRYLLERPKSDAQYKCGACGRTLEAPPPTGLAPGTRVGRFEIVSELGRGRTGIVYRAKDTEGRREVALKVLAGTDRERFLREAEAVRKLQHGHIAAVHDVGEADGKLYVAMEILEGRTLDKAGLKPREALVVLEQVARALAHAHKLGFVHRDVRAPNVMVTRHGDGSPWAYLLDFACPPPGAATSEQADIDGLAAILGGIAGDDRKLAARPPASAREFASALHRRLNARKRS